MKPSASPAVFVLPCFLFSCGFSQQVPVKMAEYGGGFFMTEYIHVSVAWPYANGDLHIGHLAGVYLPADIFARYHRLKGNHVLMVSGSDAHGTPILVEADQRGIPARELFEHYHQHFLE